MMKNFPYMTTACSMRYKLTSLLIALLAVTAFFVMTSAQADDVPAEEKAKASITENLSSKALIAMLGDESYLKRKQAFDELWKRGKKALPTLKEAKSSKDPEIAARASELYLYLTAGVLMDSPEEVKSLVIRYSRAEDSEKLDIIKSLIKMQSWEQVLHLANHEKKENLRKQFSSSVKTSANAAALAAIKAGNFAEAERILSLVKDDPQVMPMLAWLYCHQGRYDQEIRKAKAQQGANARQWRIALHMAQNNQNALQAELKGEDVPGLKAMLELLAGDPGSELMLLQQESNNAIVTLASKIQNARIKGNQKEADALARELGRMAGNEAKTSHVAVGLALNGYKDKTLALLKSSSPDVLANYYDISDMPDLAIQALGIPEDEKPPYTNFIKQKTEQALDDEDEEAYGELIKIASLLDRYGHPEHARAIVTPLMAGLEESGSNAWYDLLSDMVKNGLGWLAVDFVRQRGNEDDQMVTAVDKIYPNCNTVGSLWGILEERHDDINQALDDIAMLGGALNDPEGKAVKLQKELIEEIQKKKKPDELRELYETLLPFALSRGDLISSENLVAKLAEGGEQKWKLHHLFYLKALNRWKEAKPIIEGQLEKYPSNFRAHLNKYAALKKLKKDKEAKSVYDRMLLITLGDVGKLRSIGSKMIELGFKDEGFDLLSHALILARAQGKNHEVQNIILNLAFDSQSLFYDKEQWSKAWAFNEAASGVLMFRDDIKGNLAPMLRLSHNADFTRAMRLYSNGKREKAIKLLEKCLDVAPGNGVLADHFFPILHRIGLPKNYYNAWFDRAYKQVAKSCEQYPNDHNSHNSAAWLSSRALRNLDEAHKHIAKALELQPRQAAYTDTMAEVFFAQGNRKKAIELSREAVNQSITHHQRAPGRYSNVIQNYQGLLEQLHRFEKDPLPAAEGR